MFAQGRSEYGGEETGRLEMKKLKGKKVKKVLTEQWTRGQRSPSSVPRKMYCLLINFVAMKIVVS